MTRVLAIATLCGWCGATLLLAELRWFRRPSLLERLRPYAPDGRFTEARSGVLSVASFRDVIGPIARGAGERTARLFGVSEELGVRLERVHSPLDVTGFRLRQLGWTAGAFSLGAVVVLTLGFPAPIAIVVLAGLPLLAFLIVEQRLASASADWQRRVFLELPVVAEQLGMLLSSGYSLGAGLSRIARRGDGAVSTDLARVCARIGQGLSEVDALSEWQQIVRVDAAERLVAVLALNRETGDLGRMISDEARSIRRECQRELIETIERRAQQVWIPVTVATLLPGAIFMAVPFVTALDVFKSGS